MSVGGGAGCISECVWCILEMSVTLNTCNKMEFLWTSPLLSHNGIDATWIMRGANIVPTWIMVIVLYWVLFLL